jgi:hypothetical protein
MKVQPADSVRTFIRFSILDGGVSRNSVVALNALVLDPPNSLLDGELVQEIVSSGITAAKDTDVSPIRVTLILGFHFRVGDTASGEVINKSRYFSGFFRLTLHLSSPR